MARPIADFVIGMGIDGRVVSQGSIADALAQNKSLAKEVSKEEQALEKTEEVVDTEPVGPESKPDGKLIVAEEIEEGHVSWKSGMSINVHPSTSHRIALTFIRSVKLYFSGLGGNHPMLFFVTFLLGIGITDFTNTIQTWYLGYWASQYEDHPAQDVNVF